MGELYIYEVSPNGPLVGFVYGGAHVDRPVSRVDVLGSAAQAEVVSPITVTLCGVHLQHPSATTYRIARLSDNPSKTPLPECIVWVKRILANGDTGIVKLLITEVLNLRVAHDTVDATLVATVLGSNLDSRHAPL